MKKNYFLIVLLLVANIFSASAKIEKIFSTEALCNVTIEVDNASNVSAATRAGRGTQITLTNGVNNLELNNSSENPLQIKAAENAEIVSCFINGDKVTPGGDGSIRVAITEGLNIVLTTKTHAANPMVTFSVTDPSQIIVKADDMVIEDISSPKEFAKGTELTIAPTTGFEIKNVATTQRPELPSVNGVYTIRVDQEMTIYVTTEPAKPVVTFEIDFPERISVVNQSTHKAIDISSLKLSMPKGTVLEFQASNENYSITSFKVDGTDKAPAIGSKTYYVGVEANTIVTIETSSTTPSVKFIVDNPENVKVHKMDSEEMLDVMKAYEMEKNTQLVIEPANDEVRIASVTVNGVTLTPLGNGNYMTAVTTNLTIEVKTKEVLPVLTFKVDASERIKVLSGTDILDISEAVELPIGTEITIEPSAGNFIIKSAMADGKTLTASDNKYLVTITGDMQFDIKTAASLTLHIIQPDEGGTISVFRDGKELQEGDKIITNEKLSFKNEPEASYFFEYYLVNNKVCSDTYVVSGSDDINVGAIFRTIREGYVEVTFDLDEGARSLLTIVNIDGSEKTRLDPSKPCEIKKESQIQVFMITQNTKITSCTMNGVERTPDGDEGIDARSYTMTVEDDAVIAVRTSKLVQVGGDITYGEDYNPIGRIRLRHEGKIYDDVYIPVGTTVEVIVEPVTGYMLDFCYLSYDEANKLDGTTYTVENTDKDIIIIKGAFKKIPDGIESISSMQSHYDAQSMQIITTGGNTKVYAVSGKKVLESDETSISVSTLESGIYVVKTREGVFKLVKK
ncbi:hypothetical protein H8744_03510 [Oscillospiraceae bacterium N12]|uniref:Por secretion system C-terminal sorting domain-containing protein n=1 Tax=Jilunia laotingensis TaxID=2763675 RepID=A0A926F3I4_9BACT|nr:hypothetical protein [Jilunia laotingensis]MBC8592322.1 hypothetical protein [Jilunia laotingensis]